VFSARLSTGRRSISSTTRLSPRWPRWRGGLTIVLLPEQGAVFLGLGTLAAGRARFEVEGADLAAGLLTEHGVPAGDIGRVWEAIALHGSVGLADRMGLLTYLTHKGANHRPGGKPGSVRSHRQGEAT